MKSHSVYFALALAISVTACSAATETTPSTPATTDAGGAAATKFGDVTIVQTVEAGGKATVYSSAFFLEGSLQAAGGEESGGCQLLLTPEGGPPGGGISGPPPGDDDSNGGPPAGIRPLSAGNLELLGATVPAGVKLVLAGGRYALDPPAAASQRWWSGGETITLRAQGADSPAFDVAQTAPGTVTVTGPTLPPSTESFSLKGTADLAIAWTPTPGAMVGVSIVTTNQSRLVCVFPGADGHATVPSSLQKKLPRTDAEIDIGGTMRKEVDVKEWHVRYVLASTGVTPSGAPSKRSVHLE